MTWVALPPGLAECCRVIADGHPFPAHRIVRRDVRYRVVARRERQLLDGGLRALWSEGSEDRPRGWHVHPHVADAYETVRVYHPRAGWHWDDAWRCPAFRAAVRAAQCPEWWEELDASLASAALLGGNASAVALARDALPEMPHRPSAERVAARSEFWGETHHEF